jgi:hypothetical protein
VPSKQRLPAGESSVAWDRDSCVLFNQFNKLLRSAVLCYMKHFAIRSTTQSCSQNVLLRIEAAAPCWAASSVMALL